MRTLIENGWIVDGSGQPRSKSNLVIEDELIASIGDSSEGGVFDRVIDAVEMIVAPGFIDTHSHSDLEVMINPYVEAKIRQGVTTELLGQDGISMAPLPKRYISPWRKNLAGLDGDSDEVGWDYETTQGYLRALEEKGVGLNESYLVPHGNVRMEAMGLDNRKPSADELERMCGIVRREMEAGAFGLSTGLIYMPCAYAETAELIELCKVVAEFDGAFVVHQRSEADTILSSMEEVIDIGAKSGVRIHFSHFKVCGRKNWATHRLGSRAAGHARGRGDPDIFRPVSVRGRKHHAGRDSAAVGARWGHRQATGAAERAWLRKRMMLDIESRHPRLG